mgnify:CR=1 FL=1
MIYWYRKLYTDDKVQPHTKKIQKKILSGKGKKKYYVILLSRQKENLLEVLKTDVAFYRFHKEEELYVIGLASTWEKAVQIIQEILVEGYGKNPDFQLKNSFSMSDFQPAGKNSDGR